MPEKILSSKTAREETQDVRPKQVNKQAPVSVSHFLINLSVEPEYKKRSSSESVRHVTVLVCPRYHLISSLFSNCNCRIQPLEKPKKSDLSLDLKRRGLMDQCMSGCSLVLNLRMHILDSISKVYKISSSCSDSATITRYRSLSHMSISVTWTPTENECIKLPVEMSNMDTVPFESPVTSSPKFRVKEKQYTSQSCLNSRMHWPVSTSHIRTEAHGASAEEKIK